MSFGELIDRYILLVYTTVYKVINTNRQEIVMSNNAIEAYGILGKAIQDTRVMSSKIIELGNIIQWLEEKEITEEEFFQYIKGNFESVKNLASAYK